MLKDRTAINYMIQVIFILFEVEQATGDTLVEIMTAGTQQPGEAAPSPSYLRKIFCKMSSAKLIAPQGTDGYSLVVPFAQISLGHLFAACAGQSMDSFIGSDTWTARIENKLTELASQVMITDLA